MLAKLIKLGNTVTIIFVPSHTEDYDEDTDTDEPRDRDKRDPTGIGHSIRIDQLAKEAADHGDPIEQYPFVSTYYTLLKSDARQRLDANLTSEIKPSSCEGYPDREEFKLINGDIGPYARDVIRQHPPHPLLNRARTGHSQARTHLKSKGIEDTDTCRHCNRVPETIEHQLLICTKLKQKLRTARAIYEREYEYIEFNEAVWLKPEIMTKILILAKAKGVHI